MKNERPERWSSLPDIELYRDQVIAYMDRQHTMQNDDGHLTGSMINNYIKCGLLPHTNGKKYSREHVAYLTYICAIKQVMSVSDTDMLLKLRMKNNSVEEFYNEYCRKLDSTLNDVLTTVDGIDTDEYGEIAFDLAITAYTLKMVSERILDIFRAENEETAEENEALSKQNAKSDKKSGKSDGKAQKDGRKKNKSDAQIGDNIDETV